jgi:uncharacterized protein (TIGR03435 family)
MRARLKLALTLVAALTIQPTFAQTPAAPTPQAASAAKPILFEVVSIRMSKSQVPGGYGFTADGFDVEAWPPFMLLSLAYQFRDLDRLPGLQPWCITDRYDVRAKVADADVAAWQKLDSTAKSLALQALLEDRFHLKAHRETKEGRIYELVVAKGGPKLKESKPVVVDPNAPPVRAQVSVGFHAESMDQFASSLPNLGISRPVVNKTGLTGLYDFNLKAAPEADSSGPAPGNSDSATIYALQEQLGLDLKPATGPVETLVIDHIERPSEN